MHGRKKGNDLCRYPQLSKHKFRKILRGFAEDLSASQTARTVTVSLRSVTSIFSKLRTRIEKRINADPTAFRYTGLYFTLVCRGIAEKYKSDDGDYAKSYAEYLAITDLLQNARDERRAQRRKLPWSMEPSRQPDDWELLAREQLKRRFFVCDEKSAESAAKDTLSEILATGKDWLNAEWRNAKRRRENSQASSQDCAEALFKELVCMLEDEPL